MIKEHTDDFIAQVTEEIEIEKHFHGDIIGKGGKQVQEVNLIILDVTVKYILRIHLKTYILVTKRFQCSNQIPIKRPRRKC